MIHKKKYYCIGKTTFSFSISDGKKWPFLFEEFKSYESKESKTDIEFYFVKVLPSLEKKYTRYRNYKIFDNGFIVDKYPLNIIHLGLIAKLFPGARIILAIRHPYDVCLSNFMQLFKLNDAMANFTNIPDTARCYDQVMGLGLQYLKLPALQFHQIRYEDLVDGSGIVKNE